MSHAYPLARTVDEALAAEGDRARTRRDAETAAGDEVLVASLETEWLTPAKADREALIARAESGVEEGFVQRYEDADGAPVLAVTYWKLVDAPKPKKAAPKAKKKVADEHTDDLYFRAGRTKSRRRRKASDPNQLDLFGGPDQQGYERRDPDNPGVVLTDEEGDGTAFGVAPRSEQDDVDSAQ
ncbi:MAG: hypothetical protein AAFX03_11705 [Pseudomonadota bacterium]